MSGDGLGSATNYNHLIPGYERGEDLAAGMRKRAALYREAVDEDIALKVDLLEAASAIDFLCDFIEQRCRG